MLEVKNLCKTYKSKNGVNVKAVDDLSIKFPDKGMVFIKGKSGCGKSTTLNLLGGLDTYDSGEIIVKGVSTKDFSQQYFDSYRNTYVGFIFQEYNLLEDFTVGANIALAMELQGKKATDEEINAILEKVDLQGLGKRKPNELSGGQKQRVAIARALIKNPEIILADEPTGALDSKTGKQLLTTLKNLSKDKLVIVVSHDDEFAYQYADRIIELADGKLINDITAEKTESIEVSDSDRIKDVLEKYHLSKEDKEMIDAYLNKYNEKSIKETRNFQPTIVEKIKNDLSKKFELIKSHLPIKYAVRIGTSSFRNKKFRLVVTIILSVVAFTLFGLTDVASSYDLVNNATKSIIDNNINNVVLTRQELRTFSDEFLGDYDIYYDTVFDDAEKAVVENKTGLKFIGMLQTNETYANSIYRKSDEFNYDYVINSLSTGCTMSTITMQDIDRFGYSLLGKLPSKDDEIVITDLIVKIFEKYGYLTYDPKLPDKQIKVTINEEKDLIGKTLNVNDSKEYTIVGVINTHFNWERYKDILNPSNTDEFDIFDAILIDELANEVSSGLSGCVFVSENVFNETINPEIAAISNGGIYVENQEDSIYFNRFAKINSNRKDDIIFFDSNKTQLEKNEILIPYYFYQWQKDTILEEHKLVGYNWQDDNIDYGTIKIVGYYAKDNEQPWDLPIIVWDELYNKLYEENVHIGYKFLVAPMPEGYYNVKDIVTFSLTEHDKVIYNMANTLVVQLVEIDSVLDEVSEVLLYVGIFFALFAALLLSNYIATSIVYKKRDIGVLRAIGSRSSDVYKIFLSESIVIALINFVLASLATGLISYKITDALRSEYHLLITFMNFSIRQIVLILLVSVVVAALASFLPVIKISRKKPVDAINNK